MPREYALNRFVRQIGALLQEVGEVQEEGISLLPPPPGVPADLGLPCFLLARWLRRPPASIAADLVSRLAPPPGSLIGSLSAQGPCLYFALEPRALAREVPG